MAASAKPSPIQGGVNCFLVICIAVYAMTGHPHVLKNKLLGKKTGLVEQRAMIATEGEKEEFMAFGGKSKLLMRTTKML